MCSLSILPMAYLYTSQFVPCKVVVHTSDSSFLECAVLTQLHVVQLKLGSSCPVYVQLHTSRQLAVIIVHTHPWVPCKHHLLEELARQQQQAPVAQILESAETDSIEHSADWEEIVTYLQTVTLENLHQYVPLGRRQSPGPLISSPDLDDDDSVLTSMHCSTSNETIASLLFSAALQNRLTACLCHCNCSYGDLLSTQVCCDATSMHCSTSNDTIASLLFCAARQNRLTACLCHCNYTCGGLLSTQVCTDATSIHCSTGEGRIASLLFSAALQHRLTACLCHCR